MLIALFGLLVVLAHLLDGLSVESGMICGCQSLPVAAVVLASGQHAKLVCSLKLCSPSL